MFYYYLVNKRWKIQQFNLEFKLKFSLARIQNYYFFLILGMGEKKKKAKLKTPEESGSGQVQPALFIYFHLFLLVGG